MIICSEFKGNSGRETIATIDCEGTLFDQFKQAFNFIIARLHKSFKIESLEREEKLEIPEVAIREALLNIIVHRNYHMKSPSKIAIYQNRIEFFSPGRFPGPFFTQNICSGITYLRNPAICKVLREAKYIEKLGSGLITIFNSYEEYNLEKPQLIDGGDCVKCILPREKKNLEKIKISDEEKILQLFSFNKDMSIKDIQRELSVSASTALRRLNEMMEQGYIERIGQKRGIRYCLKNNPKVKDLYYIFKGFYLKNTEIKNESKLEINKSMYTAKKITLQISEATFELVFHAVKDEIFYGQKLIEDLKHNIPANKVEAFLRTLQKVKCQFEGKFFYYYDHHGNEIMPPEAQYGNI